MDCDSPEESWSDEGMSKYSGSPDSPSTRSAASASSRESHEGSYSVISDIDYPDTPSSLLSGTSDTDGEPEESISDESGVPVSWSVSAVHSGETPHSPMPSQSPQQISAVDRMGSLATDRRRPKINWTFPFQRLPLELRTRTLRAHRLQTRSPYLVPVLTGATIAPSAYSSSLVSPVFIGRPLQLELVVFRLDIPKSHLDRYCRHLIPDGDSHKLCDAETDYEYLQHAKIEIVEFHAYHYSFCGMILVRSSHWSIDSSRRSSYSIRS